MGYLPYIFQPIHHLPPVELEADKAANACLFQLRPKEQSEKPTEHYTGLPLLS
jgi:hypothetical protein